MSPCSCQMKLIVSSNDCWLQEWNAFSNTLVWIIHICRYNEAHENSNIYIYIYIYVKYMYSIYFKHVYFFITSSAISKLFLIQSTTIVFVCVFVCVCVCVRACVCMRTLVWKHDNLENVYKSEHDSGMSSTSDILFHNQVNKSELIFYRSQNLEVHWHIHKNLWCIHYLLRCDIMQSPPLLQLCSLILVFSVSTHSRIADGLFTYVVKESFPVIILLCQFYMVTCTDCCSCVVIL